MIITRHRASLSAFGLLWLVTVSVLGQDANSSLSPSDSQTAFHFCTTDVYTGGAVEGAVISGQHIQNQAPTSLDYMSTTGHDRCATLIVKPGQYAFQVSAKNYKDVRLVFQLDAGRHLRVNVKLLPPHKPDELRHAESSLKSGYHQLYGYVIDEASGAPLSGVDIHLQGTEAHATTNDKGFFEMAVKVSPNTPADEASTVGTVEASLAGYHTYIWGPLQLSDGGGSQLNMEMRSGQGQNLHHSEAAGDDAPEFQESPHSAEPRSKSLQNWIDRRDETTSAPAGGTGPLSLIQLPNTIYVGSDCVKTVCQIVTPYPFEEYVALGLSSEWTASWNDDSLKAGAVAYRSVGAYYVNNQVALTYDICDNDSCQAFLKQPPDPRTEAAAAATAGIVLSQNEVTPIKAEYSRESNGGHACGDGFVGDGGGWPCMADNLNKGATHKGHSRGMSTNGSHRWARGKDVNDNVVTQRTGWQCILDHYYNDAGNSSGAGTGDRTAHIVGPGGDGQFAFAAGNGIYTTGVDGSNPQFIPVPNGAAFLSFSQNPRHIGFMTTDTNYNMLLARVDTITGNIVYLTPGNSEMYVLESDWSPLGTFAGNTVVFAYCDENAYPYAPCQLYRVQADGTALTQLTNPADYWDNEYPAWSPDGTQIAYYRLMEWCEPYCKFQPGIMIALMGAAGGGGMNLTPVGGDSRYASWSPDSNYIVFTQEGELGYDVWRMDSQTGSDAILLTSDDPYTFYLNPHYSQDGKYIVYYQEGSQGEGYDFQPQGIWSIRSDLSGQPQLLIDPSEPYFSSDYAVTRCRRFNVD